MKLELANYETSPSTIPNYHFFYTTQAPTEKKRGGGTLKKQTTVKAPTYSLGGIFKVEYVSRRSRCQPRNLGNAPLPRA